MSLTVILLSYKREKNIEKIVSVYATYAIIKEIIVWNNNPDSKLESAGKMVAINCGREMGLDCRFNAALLAKTDAIMTHDDDMLFSERAINSLYTEWERDPEVIHGVFGRTPKNGKYAEFSDYVEKEFEMVLSGAAVFSKKHIAQFFENRNSPEIVEAKSLISKLKTHPDNGEDILFSYSVMKSTGRKNKTHAIERHTPLAGNMNSGVSASFEHMKARNIMLAAALKLNQ